MATSLDNRQLLLFAAYETSDDGAKARTTEFKYNGRFANHLKVRNSEGNTESTRGMFLKLDSFFEAVTGRIPAEERSSSTWVQKITLDSDLNAIETIEVPIEELPIEMRQSRKEDIQQKGQHIKDTPKIEQEADISVVSRRHREMTYVSKEASGQGKRPRAEKLQTASQKAEKKVNSNKKGKSEDIQPNAILNDDKGGATEKWLQQQQKHHVDSADIANCHQSVDNDTGTQIYLLDDGGDLSWVDHLYDD